LKLTLSLHSANSYCIAILLLRYRDETFLMAANKLDQENELVARIVAGDEKAFTTLFFNYLPILQSFALKFTKSEIAAEEIIQDTFLRIWLSRDKLEAVENVKAYLYKFVSNECLSYLRKSLRETKILENARLSQQTSSNNTIDTINLNEINALVTVAVNKLPHQRRKIYLLSRVEGKNIQEIAEILNLSPNTVKNSLVSALKSIRIYLVSHGISFVFLYFIVI